MARDRAADRASGEGDPGPGGIRRDQIWPRRHGASPSVRVRLLAMRIIAGEFRGRRLAAPKGLGTRPMLDRVREAIFSTLTPWFGDPVVLDLFAGSGSLGLEALSRGARRVRFVERDPRAGRTLVSNLETLSATERAELWAGDALSAEAFRGGPYDVTFLDPPFPLVRTQSGRTQVHAAIATLQEEAMASDGVCVLHVPLGQLRERDFGPGMACREATYGGQSVWFVQRD